jgi:hypothetical protein
VVILTRIETLPGADGEPSANPGVDWAIRPVGIEPHAESRDWELSDRGFCAHDGFPKPLEAITGSNGGRRRS